MTTLAQTLAMTTPVSPLLRKARRLGLCGVEAMIDAAVARGCDHYRSLTTTVPAAPPSSSSATTNW